LTNQTIHVHEPTWRPAGRLLRTRLPEGLRTWLLDASSLTRRLQDACDGHFRVRLITQGRQRPLRSEARALGMRPGCFALVRQVQLLCNEVPWVFARTVIPPRTLSGRTRLLAGLGEQPLGQFLFASPSMRRGRVEVARIVPGTGLFRSAARGLEGEPSVLWGRRSLFRLDGKPLLVSEIFLPGRWRSC